MPPPSTLDRLYSVSISSPASYRIIGNPRGRWPRESDLTAWLADNLDRLTACLDLQRLEYRGREVVVGERWTVVPAWPHRDRIVGGMRLDLAARDERDRTVIVEV